LADTIADGCRGVAHAGRVILAEAVAAAKAAWVGGRTDGNSEVRILAQVTRLADQRCK